MQASRLFDHIRSALDRHGDTDVVLEFLHRLERRSTGTELQRASAARHGTLAGVVDDLVALTAQR
jgi:glutamate---cysteine ligase / carboxylate-amine ligase